ncbi:hydroxysqualene dehydroxylase HpnE [Rubripirellula reticaptiva]|uniref:15-cis-phytoene desaturase n=1 Tax=Rubripirellula reticaptiva TaxID=2528013 RepID=A0A5C6F916_9BACT|nr:hydroxysqualene dehydroxylase HpnE [Rubripirellula reticaptiva]TWU57382.1 15-cis-phytoene desaturase [Rubripirellula reticaptiva]
MTASTPKKRVVIIGGGLAGLSAADAITTAAPDRFDITVIESKRTTGGRAGSFTDDVTGETVDYCQHVAMGCCTNLLLLMHRHGLAGHWQRYDRLRFLHPKYLPSPFKPSRWLPPPFHLMPAFNSLRYLSSAQKRQIAGGLWRLMRTIEATLVDQKASTWLRKNKQDDQTITRFWDVVLVSALGETTDRVSMAAARKVLFDGFVAARGASDIWIPKLPLSDLIGNKLVNSIARHGASVIQQCAISQVDAGEDHQAIVLATDGRRFAATHVISAVPWFRIESLFAGSSVIRSLPSIGQWTQFPTSPITGIHLWFDRPIMDVPHAVMVGTTAQWIFREPHAANHPSPSGRHYYQVVVSASHQTRQLPQSELIRTVQSELAHQFPAAREAKLLANRVVTDPRSVFSVTPDVERRRPLARTALPWLHLAGDWIQTGWPATMEGAVISGRMAAASVLDRCGITECPIDPGIDRGWLTRRLIR